MKLKNTKNLYHICFLVLTMSIIIAMFISHLYNFKKRSSLQLMDILLYISLFVTGAVCYYILKSLKGLKLIANITIFLLYCVLMLFVSDDIVLFSLTMIFISLLIFTANTLLEKYSYPQISRKWKIALAAPSCFVFILFQGLNIYGSQQISKVVSQIREKSYMLNSEEVNQMYDKIINPKENGGALLVACAEIISRSEIFDNINRKDDEKLTEEDFKKIEEYIIRYEKEFTMLSEILSYPQLIIPLRFPDPVWNMLFPHLSHLSSVARKMSFIACYQQHVGENQLAIKSIQQIFKVASSLTTEPSILSALVQSSIERTGAITILRFIQNGASKENILELQNTIEPFCQYKPFPIHEELMCIYNIINETNDMSALERWDFFSEITGFSHFMDLPGHMYLSRGFNKIDISVGLQRLLNLSEVQISGEKAVLQQFKKTKNRSYFLYPIASIFDIEIEERNLIDLAVIRCIFIAIQLELEQIKMGKYPDSLDSITASYPKHTTDPFTGRQLIYKSSENSYVLYSVGKDMEDNGGNVQLDFRAKDIGIKWEK